MYALHLFRAPEGRDSLAWARSHYRGPEEDEVPESCLFSAEERAALARSLTEADPRLKAEAEEDGTYWVSDDAEGAVDYEVFDDSILVGVAPMPSGHAPEETVRGVLAVTGAVARRHGLGIYDPQEDRLLDPAADFESVLARYLQVLEADRTRRRIGGGRLPVMVVALLVFAGAAAGALLMPRYAPLFGGAAFLVLTAWMLLQRRPR